jgi:hypothetical protein
MRTCAASSDHIFGEQIDVCPSPKTDVDRCDRGRLLERNLNIAPRAGNCPPPRYSLAISIHGEHSVLGRTRIDRRISLTDDH